jgi:hypothetical protein
MYHVRVTCVQQSLMMVNGMVYCDIICVYCVIVFRYRARIETIRPSGQGVDVLYIDYGLCIK